MIALAVGVVMVVWFGQPKLQPEITGLTDPWEKAVPHQEVPDGLNSLSAEECGKCHVQHYEEWKTSTHANAWTDAQFQAEIAKKTSPFFCINCHIPLQNQQEYIVDGYIDGDLYRPHRKKNPNWDVSLQQEGITCAACHVRDGAIIGPTGTSDAPHRTVKNSAHLSESLCIGCHNATAAITPELVCSFETGDEWKAGPYFGEKNCISCHMPELQRSIVEGMPERTSHYHSFTGSGIPKHDTLKVQILKSLNFEWLNLKHEYQSSQVIPLQLSVTNSHAGHRVPTGDPERFILINLNVYDASNNLVQKKTYRIGEKWKWYPSAKKLGDNNLNPGESRKYDLPVSELKPGKYQVELIVTKHRMTPETATHNGLDDSYPRYIQMHSDEINFIVQ